MMNSQDVYYRVTLRWSHWFGRSGLALSSLPTSTQSDGRVVLQFNGGEKADFEREHLTRVINA